MNLCLPMLLLACTSFSEPPEPAGYQDLRTDTATFDSDPSLEDSAPAPVDSDPFNSTDPVVEPDAAELVTHLLPTQLECGETIATRVSMRNTGTATWTHDDGYKLGAVDDTDPFYDQDTRIWMAEGTEVPPGAAWSFEFELTAPDSEGTWTTDWQMVHEHVRWFGDTASVDIQVSCAAAEQPDEPPPLDLSQVTWLHTDVSHWSETGTLSSVSLSSSEICLDYNKADSWPITDYNGVEVVGNPWVFIYQDEQWYGGTFEWLRPGQTCKSIEAVAGSHIKVSPFSEDGGWVPSSGEVFYFMVSGLARSSLRNAEERTGTVRVVWP